MPPRTPRRPRRRTLNADAAGIDVGATSHYAAVPADRDREAVRRFGSFTEDLFALADWLSRCRIKTVAMEATGVYWIPLFEILERRGFEVILVNARHVRNVPGRKSDVLDCQWLQELHSLGLLSASFRPADTIVALRGFSGAGGGPALLRSCASARCSLSMPPLTCSTSRRPSRR